MRMLSLLLLTLFVSITNAETYRIHAGGGYGSATPVASDDTHTYWLSASHVIKGSTCKVLTTNDIGTVLYRDRDLDILVFKTKNNNYSLSPLATEAPPVGDQVSFKGWGMGRYRDRDNVTLLSPKIDYTIRTDMTALSGDSGGAFLNSNDEVVGTLYGCWTGRSNGDYHYNVEGPGLTALRSACSQLDIPLSNPASDDDPLTLFASWDSEAGNPASDEEASINLPEVIYTGQPAVASLEGVSITDFAQTGVIRVYPSRGGIDIFDSVSLLKKKPQILLFPKRVGEYTLVVATIKDGGTFLEHTFTVESLKDEVFNSQEGSEQ